MPGLTTTLSNYDLDLLKRIARRWNVEISERDVVSARADLEAKLNNIENFQKMWLTLEEPTRKAWTSLAQNGGKVPWIEFSRTYGEIRDFGPGRREREQPDLKPISAAEALWYSGLAGIAFLRSAGEPVEYIYIPDELLKFASPYPQQSERIEIRPAVSQNPRHIKQARSAIPDYLTDLLAAQRMQREMPDTVFETWGVPRTFLQMLLLETGLTDKNMQPIPDGLRKFFSTNRADVQADIFKAWLNTAEFNELRMLPGLIFEGTWMNDPLPPRKRLIEWVSGLNCGTWWSLSSLIASVKAHQPDFQRAAGEYDTWFIREAGSSTYLGGFDNWDQIEGALLTYLITGPLHWLGLVRLARSGVDGKLVAFQLVEEMLPLMSGQAPEIGMEERVDFTIKDVRFITLFESTSRILRYQVARFTELVNINKKESHYALTSKSLKSAAEQGLQITQLIHLLEKENSNQIPESLRNLARRWSSQGSEAAVNRVSLLRFANAAACDEFLKHTAGRFKLEELNGQTLAFNEKQQEGVIKALSELGILVEFGEDV